MIAFTFNPPIEAAISGTAPPCEPPITRILSLPTPFAVSFLKKSTISLKSIASVLLIRFESPPDKPWPLTLYVMV